MVGPGLLPRWRRKFAHTLLESDEANVDKTRWISRMPRLPFHILATEKAG